MPALPPVQPAPSDGRYHRLGEAWPLYAALDAATTWAEWNAATRGAVDPAGVMRTLWRLDVGDLPVVDLRDRGVRHALGVEVEDLTGRWSSSQPVADRAREAGAAGMVVPSAARPGSWCLVVFPVGWDRVRVADGSPMHPEPPDLPATLPGA